MEQASTGAHQDALAWAPQPGPQSLLVTCSVPDILFGGARGGGKSDGLLGDWGIHSARYPGRGRGLIVRRTYDELDELVQRSHELYGPIGAEWKPSRYTWTMPWGGFLKMRYLRRDEDAGRYQGHSYNWLAVDEAGNFPSFDPIKKLKATLRDKTGVPVRFRATANPGGPGHAEIKRQYIDPAPPLTPFPDPDTGLLRVYIPSRLEDNRLLMENDPTYVQRLRGSGPAWLVQAWLHGDWNAAPDGGVFRIPWFPRYDRIPDPPEAFMVVHSWDTAYKAKQFNDPSVLTVWVVTTNGYYLREVYRERLEYPTLKTRMIQYAERDKPHVILIEDKASGQSLIQELGSATTMPIRPILPEGDKLTRALAVTPQIETGRVWLPRTAPWLLDYELELSMFPTPGGHDDQVDSTTQFLAWAREHAGRGLTTATAGARTFGAAGSRTYGDDTGWGTIPAQTDTAGFL